MKKFYSMVLAILITGMVSAQNNLIPAIRGNASVSNIMFQSGKTSGHAELIPILTEEDSRVPAPGNDNCTGGLAAAYTLVPDAACVQGVTTASTLETGETYGCITPTPTFSVWYSFVADATAMYVTVSGISGSLCSINFGVNVYAYNGNCPPNAAAVGCRDDVNVVGPNSYADYVYSTVNLTGLTIGATYLIQITQENCVTTTRKFCVEVGHPTACTTCSSTCGALCYYPSATPPNVSWLQANCPLYRLQPPMNENDNVTMCFTFTAPNPIVNLQLGNTTYCNGYTYAFNWTCYSSACGSPIASGSYTPTTISGLTTGQNYILCYNWTTTCSWESVWPYIYATNLLPIELSAFDARANKNDIDIYWTTASETNTSEFVIEKTTDGQNFTMVSKVKAAGNSTTTRNYSVKDLKPILGNNYYRLKEIDIDGKINFGELVSARFSKDFTGLSVMPNPAQNEIGVNFTSAKNAVAMINIVDSKGVVVYTKMLLADNDGLNTYPVNISLWQPGIYSVRLLNTDETLNTRFIKQ
jgi:hypothetical protein